MYPIVSPNGPAPTGGYVPYFYHAGLFQRYGVPAALTSRSAPDESVTPYRFSSDTPLFGHLDQLQTVEQIIAHGYFAPPPGDPVTAILSDKQTTSRLGLDDIIGQIRHRYEMYHQNMYELELAKTAAANSLYAAWAYHGPPSEKQFYSRHKRTQELYEAQREERVNLWRDVSRLRLALPETAQSYLSAHRKLQALETTPGDEP